jgi:5-methylcytosine-specific restriction endonuclease McrA
MPTRKPNGKRLNGKGSGWITRKRRFAIYFRDGLGTAAGLTCAYCECHLDPFRSPRGVHLDHLEPKVNGANHASENLVAACHNCNSQRRQLPLPAFVAQLVGRRAEFAGWPDDARARKEADAVRSTLRRIRNRARRSMVKPLALAAEYIRTTSTPTFFAEG